MSEENEAEERLEDVPTEELIRRLSLQTPPFPSLTRYDEAYAKAWREMLDAWEKARAETLAGQADRLAEATADLMRVMIAPLRAWLDEAGEQLRDLFAVMADSAEAIVAYFDRDEEEPKP